MNQNAEYSAVNDAVRGQFFSQSLGDDYALLAQ